MLALSLFYRLYTHTTCVPTYTSLSSSFSPPAPTFSLSLSLPPSYPTWWWLHLSSCLGQTHGNHLWLLFYAPRSVDQERKFCRLYLQNITRIRSFLATNVTFTLVPVTICRRLPGLLQYLVFSPALPSLQSVLNTSARHPFFPPLFVKHHIS